MNKTRKKSDTQPKFPYTTSPAALRRLLQEIPKRPKPGKLTLDLIKTWDVTSSNDASPLGVLKKLGLLSAAGEPTPAYADFMLPPPVGPRALGARMREHYRDLFETSHAPQKNATELRTFFNINSGGGERAIQLQAQTFTALSEYADFTGAGEGAAAAGGGDAASGKDAKGGGGASKLPPVQIDLHIHLPENKSARDYESIIQDIAKYIYGRTGEDRA
jgi:hypothetical protein